MGNFVDYISLTNSETNEVFVLNVTGVDCVDVHKQLSTLPKDKSGKHRFGNVLIHQHGGGVINSIKHE